MNNIKDLGPTDNVKASIFVSLHDVFIPISHSLTVMLFAGANIKQYRHRYS